MAKKNVNPIIGFGALLISAISFFLGTIKVSLIFSCVAVVLIIADYCREQKSNVWSSLNYSTNLDSYLKNLTIF